MNTQERQELVEHLFELINLQDTITHNNEAGLDISDLRKQRDDKVYRIVRWVARHGEQCAQEQRER